MGANCVIQKMSDIGEVAEVASDCKEGAIVKRVVVGEIDGVLSIEEYPSCIVCNAKVKVVNEVVGECTKCGIVVKTKKCKKMVMAKVVVSGEDGRSNVLTMFNEMVLKMIKGVDGKDLAMKLLMAVPYITRDTYSHIMPRAR